LNQEKLLKVKNIFEQALEIDSDKRDKFINEHCGNDDEIKNEVLSLLDAHEKTTKFLHIPPQLNKAPKGPNSFKDSFIGKRIGNYLIEKEAGVGGMGIVYKGKRDDKEFEHKVAIKILRQQFHSEYIVKRFQNERQTLANLQHPNIARLLDGGTTDDGLPYLVMEYIEGNSLIEYCDEKKLNIKQRLDIFRLVCDAVQFAHQNLIVHRDIKPGNVLVNKQGIPKLLDFGIAKLMDEEIAEENEGLTKTGVWHLTPEYASPEQIKGERITTRSDIYSLGILLYQLLTGHQPYRVTSSSPVAISKIITEGQIVKPSEKFQLTEEILSSDGNTKQITPQSVSNLRNEKQDKIFQHLKGDIDNIILKAMHKDPGQRYSSVQEFSNDIKRYLIGMPVIARKDTINYRISKFVRRHKVSVALFILVNIIVISSTIAIIFQSRIAAEERDRARLETQKADRINEFLQQMLASANPNWYVKGKVKGPDVTVIAVLNEAARRLETEMEEQPEVKADLHLTIGDTYLSLGKPGLAGYHFEAAYKLRSSLFAEDDPKSIESLFYLAVARRLQEDIDAAEKTYRKIITFLRKPKNAGNVYFPHTLDALGYIMFINKNNPAAAEPLLRESLQRFREFYGETHYTIPYGLERLGAVLIATGQINEAEKLLIQALDILSKIPGLSENDRDIRLSGLYALLGKVYLDTKRLDKAEDHLRKSIEIRIKKLPKENKDIWQSKTELGICLLKQKRYSEAEQLLVGSVEFYKKDKNTNTKRITRCLKYLAVLYQETGNTSKAKLFESELEKLNSELSSNQ